MLHATYRATMHPDYHSTSFTGEGDSPEKARKDAEAQLTAYLNQLRAVHANTALVSFVLESADYTPTVVSEPRKAVRNPNHDRRLPLMQPGFVERFINLFR